MNFLQILFCWIHLNRRVLWKTRLSIWTGRFQEAMLAGPIGSISQPEAVSEQIIFEKNSTGLTNQGSKMILQRPRPLQLNNQDLTWEHLPDQQEVDFRSGGDFFEEVDELGTAEPPPLSVLLGGEFLQDREKREMSGERIHQSPDYRETSQINKWEEIRLEWTNKRIHSNYSSPHHPVLLLKTLSRSCPVQPRSIHTCDLQGVSNCMNISVQATTRNGYRTN